MTSFRSRFQRRPAQLLLAVLLFLPALPAIAQTEIVEEDPNQIILSRTLGDQIFGFNAGLFLPLSSFNPNTGELYALLSAEQRRLSLGAVGTIRWGSFVNESVNLGLDVTWAFSVGPNDDLFSLFSPLQPRISYYFRTGLFEFPIHLGIGMNLMSYKEATIVTPLVKIGGSVIYNATPDWGFGLNILYWWVPELYPAGEGPGTDANRFGNYLEISLSAVYNF